MRHIKNLGIKTKEGFEVKNYSTFPSMEWGDDGGMQADLYYNGKKIGQVFQEGNGGCAVLHTYDSEIELTNEIKEKALTCLKRLDDSYSKYDFLKSRQTKDVNDDDFESIVVEIAHMYDIKKDVSRYIKKGFQTIFLIERDGGLCSYLTYKVNNATEQEAKDYLSKNKINFKNVVRYDATTNFKLI